MLGKRHCGDEHARGQRQQRQGAGYRALLISSRKVVQGIAWAKTLAGKGDEVPKLIEKGKTNFEGPEIKGKRLG